MIKVLLCVILDLPGFGLMKLRVIPLCAFVASWLKDLDGRASSHIFFARFLAVPSEIMLVYFVCFSRSKLLAFPV